MAQQFIYGLCEPETDIPLYVGRSKDAIERRRWHGITPSDFSPKGIWNKYLKIAKLQPNLIILEEATFGSDAEAETWAKQQEQVWIKRLFAEGNYLFNHGCWWKHPDRKEIPKGVRVAWEHLHAVYFRLEFWLSFDRDDTHNEITQFIALGGIRALVEQYPALELAPIKWLDLKRR
ncbi:hypothetical protein [Aeoliella sp. SH292]|uniref:hypothetical protein n=1 Tax=Aeoliella sp. SH292 TaxID=3454464 RepID=UPI003F9D6AA9